jgi:hypothetical protein
MLKKARDRASGIERVEKNSPFSRCNRRATHPDQTADHAAVLLLHSCTVGALHRCDVGSLHCWIAALLDRCKAALLDRWLLSRVHTFVSRCQALRLGANIAKCRLRFPGVHAWTASKSMLPWRACMVSAAFQRQHTAPGAHACRKCSLWLHLLEVCCQQPSIIITFTARSCWFEAPSDMHMQGRCSQYIPP